MLVLSITLSQLIQQGEWSMKHPLGLRVDSPRRVWFFVLLVTLFATITSLITVAVVLGLAGFGSPRMTYVIAGIVPLLVVPPVTYVLAQIAYDLTCMQAELLRLAHTDELTGLENRRAFFEHGHTLLTAATAAQLTVGLLLIDADNFKQVNDTYGHAAGDEALRHLAATIVACAAPQDIVARFGGDEFAVLRPNGTETTMRTLALAIQRALAEEQFIYRTNALTLAVSIGVADSVNYPTFDSLLLATDIALYEAKALNQSSLFPDHATGLCPVLPPTLVAKAPL
jgi:diguanylate cyclase (GGDEF)-like protein